MITPSASDRDRTVSVMSSDRDRTVSVTSSDRDRTVMCDDIIMIDHQEAARTRMLL